MLKHEVIVRASDSPKSQPLSYQNKSGFSNRNHATNRLVKKKSRNNAAFHFKKTVDKLLHFNKNRVTQLLFQKKSRNKAAFSKKIALQCCFSKKNRVTRLLFQKKSRNEDVF
jgi:hypothetical protein